MKFGFKKGILLEQNKEPALSREIKQLSALPVSVEKTEKNVPANPELLAPHEIIMMAREARIVDEYDGQRLWKKLAAAARDGISMIVADALDDEPYISSQLSLALQYGDELAEGLALAARAVGAQKTIIEIYRNLFDLNTKIPSRISGVKVERVGGRYPAEGRYGKYYKSEDVLVVGSCALMFLRRVVFEGRRQNSTFVTVSGDCVANPGNYEVPIGCSVLEVLEAVGLIADPKRIAVGGSMTGVGVTEPGKAAVTPRTRGILAFADEFKDMGFSCIGCGHCVQNCPEGLSPFFIYKSMKARHKKYVGITDALLCTGCGTCSYVCPAKLDLVQTIAKAAALCRSRQGGKP